MILDFTIQTGGHTPIYRQIVDQVRRAVAGGGVKPGDQLPSVRRLAEHLVINPNTVARAYGELIRDGVLEGRPGKGVFVAERRPVFAAAERKRRLDAALDALVAESLAIDCNETDLVTALKEKLNQLTTGKSHEQRQRH